MFFSDYIATIASVLSGAIRLVAINIGDIPGCRPGPPDSIDNSTDEIFAMTSVMPLTVPADAFGAIWISSDP